MIKIPREYISLVRISKFGRRFHRVAREGNWRSGEALYAEMAAVFRRRKLKKMFFFAYDDYVTTPFVRGPTVCVAQLIEGSWESVKYSTLIDTVGGGMYVHEDQLLVDPRQCYHWVQHHAPEPGLH